MIRDHVKARIAAVQAGHMPKITLEEYETFRMNSAEWRAIVPILTDEALKNAIKNTLNNCSNSSGTYEDALQNVYVPLLMERVFGSEAKEHNIKKPYTCSEMWDICKANPNARFAASYLRSLETGYLLKAGILPKTKEFCIINELANNYPFMDRRQDYSYYTVTRLPDAPVSSEDPARNYSTTEMWDICSVNPKARFSVSYKSGEKNITLGINPFEVKGAVHQRTGKFCIGYPQDTINVFMADRVDYSNTYIITRLPDKQDVANQTVSAKEAWDICKANPKARFEALLYGKPNEENPFNVIGGLHPKSKEFCLLNDPPWSRGSDCFATEITDNWTFRRLQDAP